MGLRSRVLLVGHNVCTRPGTTRAASRNASLMGVRHRRWYSPPTPDHGRPHVDDDISQVVSKLSSTYTNHFPVRLTQPRLIGREAEYPVVREDGRAAEVPDLLDAMDQSGDMKLKILGDAGLYCDDYEYSLEVGRGTIEIITKPCQTLQEIQDVHERAVRRMLVATSRLGLSVLGFGIQPVTEPSAALMAKRRRYNTLLRVIGDPWLLFTVTASDQVHIDVTEPELVRMINLGNLLSPLIIALCGNSSVMNGAPAEHVSSREGFGARFDVVNKRHGMPRGPFYSVHDFVGYLCSQPMLVRARTQREVWEDKDVLQPGSPGKTFMDHIREYGFDWEAFKVHDHYVWSSARPRTQQRTIEFRCACQQPWEDHMVVAALSLGITEAAADIVQDPALSHVLDWRTMRDLHASTISYGLGEGVNSVAGVDVAETVKHVLHHCEEGLRRRGFGEESYLQPLFARVESGSNPGQTAQAVLTKALQDTQDQSSAIAALVKHLSLPERV